MEGKHIDDRALPSTRQIARQRSLRRVSAGERPCRGASITRAAECSAQARTGLVLAATYELVLYLEDRHPELRV